MLCSFCCIRTHTNTHTILTRIYYNVTSLQAHTRKILAKRTICSVAILFTVFLCLLLSLFKIRRLIRVMKLRQRKRMNLRNDGVCVCLSAALMIKMWGGDSVRSVTSWRLEKVYLLEKSLHSTLFNIGRVDCWYSRSGSLSIRSHK